MRSLGTHPWKRIILDEEALRRVHRLGRSSHGDGYSILEILDLPQIFCGFVLPDRILMLDRPLSTVADKVQSDRVAFDGKHPGCLQGVRPSSRGCLQGVRPSRVSDHPGTGSPRDYSLGLPQIRTCTLMHQVRHAVEYRYPSHDRVVSR